MLPCGTLELQLPQIALHSLVLTVWPNDKLAVPELARPYWSIRHELTVHDGLLFKQDRIIIPSSLREHLLRKLHAAHGALRSLSAMHEIVCSGLALTAK